MSICFEESMSRSSVNFIVDALVALLFLSVLSTASIVHFVFPAPSLADCWSLWAMNLDTWSRIEIVAICVFAVAVIVHLILHWTWVCGFITTRISRYKGWKITVSASAKTLYGVSVLILALTALAVIYAAASFAVKETPQTQSHRSSQARCNIASEMLRYAQRDRSGRGAGSSMSAVTHTAARKHKPHSCESPEDI